MPRPKRAAGKRQATGPLRPGPVLQAPPQPPRGGQLGSSVDLVQVFDPDDPYTVQRRLLRLLVAGELAITDECYAKAMKDGFAIIKRWLESKSPLLRQRGVRALMRWRQGHGRAAALASQAAKLDEARWARSDANTVSEHKAATLAELMDRLAEIQAEQAKQAAASKQGGEAAAEVLSGFEATVGDVGEAGVGPARSGPGLPPALP